MKSLATFLLLTVPFTLAQAQSTPAPGPTGEWTKQELTPHFWAEGACAADVNKDGKVDILSGPFWYEGPAFEKRHVIYPLKQSFKGKAADGAEQEIPGFEGALGEKNTYSDNFISYAHDLNGDGWIDYVVIGFPGKETLWYENPQGQDYPWPKHVGLAVTDNESPMFVDLTGDKKPELLCMSGGFIGYAEPYAKAPDEPWTWHPISTKGPFQRFTHGIGYGDINGDGRVDILESRGWWEQPASLAGDPVWAFHEARFGDGGAQMYGYDVNGDGKTDVITSIQAHGYGVAWFEQTNDGGVTGWTKHLITGSPKEPGETGIIFSQPHAIDLADMNGDGLKDIVTGKRFWAHGNHGDPEPEATKVVWWFELKRDGGKASFIPHLIDNDSGVGTQVMATDINGDGKLDVVVGNKKGVFVHVRK
jgi:hypothetical protein